MTVDDGGSGTGKSSGVGSSNRVWVASEAWDPVSLGVLRGGAGYSFNTGLVTLTTAGESGVISIKNTDSSRILVIQRIQIGLGKSTGGNPGDVVVKLYTGTVTGTLVSAGTVVTGFDKNLGISAGPQASSTSGTEGSTMVGGTVFETWLMKDANGVQVFDNYGYGLQTNNMFSISVTPPASNTSMKVTVVLVGRYVTKSEITN